VQEIKEAREAQLSIDHLAVEVGESEEQIDQGGVLAAGELGDA
jgi:hypothetical protein